MPVLAVFLNLLRQLSDEELETHKILRFPSGWGEPFCRFKLNQPGPVGVEKLLGDKEGWISQSKISRAWSIANLVRAKSYLPGAVVFTALRSEPQPLFPCLGAILLPVAVSYINGRIDIHFLLAKSQQITTSQLPALFVCRVTKTLRGLSVSYEVIPQIMFFFWAFRMIFFFLVLWDPPPPRAYCNFCSPSVDQAAQKLNWAPPLTLSTPCCVA